MSNKIDIKIQTYFPIAANKIFMFPSGLTERFVSPTLKHSGPKDLFKIDWSKACGAISITIAFFGARDITS